MPLVDLDPNRPGRFTPVHARTGQRLELTLHPTHMAKTGRGCEWSAIVTDTETGRRFLAWDKSCGIPTCRCDAFAMQLPEGH